MKRREFITLLGGVALGGPIATHAQQPAMPVIGFLNSASLEPNRNLVEAFVQSLSQSGYVEGKNIAIEYIAGRIGNTTDCLRSPPNSYSVRWP